MGCGDPRRVLGVSGSEFTVDSLLGTCRGCSLGTHALWTLLGSCCAVLLRRSTEAATSQTPISPNLKDKCVGEGGLVEAVAVTVLRGSRLGFVFARFTICTHRSLHNNSHDYDDVYIRIWRSKPCVQSSETNYGNCLENMWGWCDRMQA